MKKIISPYISICILAFNRKDDVINSIQHIQKYSYKNIEILVVDNGSTDGTNKIIPKKFPNVVYIRNINEGISGWNQAFKKARGEILLVLDDDSFPASGALEKIAEAFSQKPNLDIMTCNIIVYSTKKTIYPNLTLPGAKPKRTYNFTGGGVVMRKKVCRNIGYFADWVFYGGHELEFSIRALQKGYKIWFYPDIKVYHDSRPVTWRFYHYCTRNHLIIGWLYFPLLYVLPFTIYYLIESFVTCVRANYPGAWFSGVFGWIQHFGLIYHKRRPLSYTLLAPFAKKILFSRFT